MIMAASRSSVKAGWPACLVIDLGPGISDILIAASCEEVVEEGVSFTKCILQYFLVLSILASLRRSQRVVVGSFAGRI